MFFHISSPWNPKHLDFHWPSTDATINKTHSLVRIISIILRLKVNNDMILLALWVISFPFLETTAVFISIS